MRYRIGWGVGRCKNCSLTTKLGTWRHKLDNTAVFLVSLLRFLYRNEYMSCVLSRVLSRVLSGAHNTAAIKTKKPKPYLKLSSLFQIALLLLLASLHPTSGALSTRNPNPGAEASHKVREQQTRFERSERAQGVSGERGGQFHNRRRYKANRAVYRRHECRISLSVRLRTKTLIVREEAASTPQHYNKHCSTDYDTAIHKKNRTFSFYDTSLVLFMRP